MHALRPNYPPLHSTPMHLRSTPDRVNAHADYRGRGIVIAYLDAGFYAHPDLAGRILTHVDCSTDTFSESQTAVPAMEGFVWHGMMSSVIGSGDGALSDGVYRGIASESQVVLVKVSSPTHQVKEADILRGFQWVLAHHQRYRIRIVNASVGGDFVNHSSDHPLHVVIRELTAQGVIVVAAAGNQGQHHLLPPASAPEAVIVGGLNDQNSPHPVDWHMYHSNYGFAHNGTRKPDVIAPAQWVASPILPTSIVAKEARWLTHLMQPHNDDLLEKILQEGQADLNLTAEQVQHRGQAVYHHLEKRLHDFKLIHPHYQHVEGTSVAAPIVASVIAQMLEIQPSLTPSQVHDLLRKAARPLHHVPPNKQGAGVLDAGQAILLTLSLSRKTIRLMTRPTQGAKKNAPRIS